MFSIFSFLSHCGLSHYLFSHCWLITETTFNHPSNTFLLLKIASKISFNSTPTSLIQLHSFQWNILHVKRLRFFLLSHLCFEIITLLLSCKSSPFYKIWTSCKTTLQPCCGHDNFSNVDSKAHFSSQVLPWPRPSDLQLPVYNLKFSPVYTEGVLTSMDWKPDPLPLP